MTELIDVIIPSKYKEFLEEELTLVKTVYSNINKVYIIRKPNPKYYISLNKLEEIKNNESSKIVIMDKVKPSQIINVMRETKKEVLDRVLLILEIFALHAGSKEAKLQIELAKLKHQLPLIKEAIRYAKLKELHGFLGAGRYGYEKYYTMTRKREARIRRELEELRKTRALRRQKRRELGYIHVAIVGYTCAGKTTLFNTLTRLNKPVGPEPFTTLSPKSRAVEILGHKVIFTDTVGFIRDLPPEIIESFYATLEEIIDANIIIHVVDFSKDTSRIIKEVIETRKILEKIGIHGKPIILALNKIDLVDSIDEKINAILKHLENNEIIIPISAIKKTNIEKLLWFIKQVIAGKSIDKNICAKIWA